METNKMEEKAKMIDEIIKRLPDAPFGVLEFVFYFLIR